MLPFLLCWLTALTPEPQDDFSWQRPQAEVLAHGDLRWAPEPFRFERGESVRYVDFTGGDDGADGTSPERAWKHHPWDPAAVARAAEGAGVHTYVFKRGVTYRGRLIADESGRPGEPIRLTSDPEWGTGEAVLSGAEPVTGWKRGLETPRHPRRPQGLVRGPRLRAAQRLDARRGGDRAHLPGAHAELDRQRPRRRQERVVALDQPGPGLRQLHHRRPRSEAAPLLRPHPPDRVRGPLPGRGAVDRVRVGARHALPRARPESRRPQEGARLPRQVGRALVQDHPVQPLLPGGQAPLPGCSGRVLVRQAGHGGAAVPAPPRRPRSPGPARRGRAPPEPDRLRRDAPRARVGV